MPGWIRGTWAHGCLSGGVVVLAVLALVAGYRRHRQGRVVGWWLGGSLGLVGVRFLPEASGEWTEVLVTVVGSGLMAVFARLNASLRFWTGWEAEGEEAK